MHKTYEIAVSGLLQKRRELFTEAEKIRDRLYNIVEDTKAIDHSLSVLGYKGDLDSQVPQKITWYRPYKRGELSLAYIEILKASETPLTAREIADRLMRDMENPPVNHHRRQDFRRKVRTSLTNLSNKGRLVKGEDTDGVFVWEMATKAKSSPSTAKTGCV